MANNKNGNKDLFSQAFKLDSKVDAAHKAWQEAIAERSRAVKAVYNQYGTKGPFSVDGKVLTIRSRREKGPDGKPLAGGKETWFFVQAGQEVISID